MKINIISLSVILSLISISAYAKQYVLLFNDNITKNTTIIDNKNQKLYEPTVTLRATKTELIEGQSTVLQWESKWSDTLVISNIGNVLLNDSSIVMPPQTTEYTASASGYNKTAQSTVTIKVIPKDNRTCKTLLEQDPTLFSKDGEYELKNGTYYCDMSNGGWTRITSIDFNSPTAGSFVMVEEPWHTTSGFPQCMSYKGWYAHFTTNARNKYQAKNIISNNEKMEWRELKIKIKPLIFATIDGFTNTHAGAYNRDSIDGMMFDGLQITVGDTGSRKHVMGITSYDNSRRSNLGINYSQMTFVGSNPTPDELLFTYSKTKNDENIIELRALLDQTYNDEDVGFEYYEVWIK